VLSTGFWFSFLVDFWLLACWLVKQPKKLFGKWLLKQLKSWLLSQNEKAAPASFLG